MEVIPIKDISTKTVAHALISGWISRFGVPRTIISDSGSQFESAAWCELMHQLGITRKRTTAYHPACNGAIERFHRTLKNSLRAKCNTAKWHDALPMVLLGLRTAINSEGYSPAQLLYGMSPELPSQFSKLIYPAFRNLVMISLTLFFAK